MTLIADAAPSQASWSFVLAVATLLILLLLVAGTACSGRRKP